jgi:Kef-type K+ transport system membrane component KefB/voltage-gated potassium channel Kch
MHTLIQDIAFCILAAWLLGVAAQFARLPVLLAYLVGGFALGPHGFNLIHDEASIATISELGLLFLLFMIGLEIDLKKILSAGKSITLTAAVQILGGALLGLLVFRLMGFPMAPGKGWDAVYLAVAGALSSTVIIVKVLYDKRELDTLTGRITLGVLVLQDLFAILFLSVQPSLDNLQPTVLLLSMVRVVALVAAALAISRFVLPPLFHRVARLPELVLVGAIAWCFAVGEFAAWLGLSREMGSLVAGVALSTYPYALDVTAKVTTLRDFFVTLFFVGLGMEIPMPTGPLILGGLAFAAFVVVSRWLTTFTPLYALRLGLRTSILPSINLSQVSEFSLVVMGLGIKAGHISPATNGAVALAFVLMAALSTFGMTASDSLVRMLIPKLRALGLRDLDDAHPIPQDAPGGAAGAGEPAHGHGHGARIVLLGFFRTASSLLQEIERNSPDLLPELAVVDFNPHVHAELKRRGVRAIYGDISQRNTLLHAGIESAELLVCTIPDSLLKGTTNIKLLRHLRSLNPTARIIVPADVLADVPGLYAAGASYVCVSRLTEAADLLEAVHASEKGLIEDQKAALDAKLQDRKEVLA